MTRRPWAVLAALTALTAVGLAGCSGDEPAKPKQDAIGAGTYVGHVGGTSANIRLVVKDNRVAAFMCTETNKWLTFPAVDLKGKKATLRADAGTEPGPGTEVDVTFKDDVANGKVDLGEIALFAAEKATALSVGACGSGSFTAAGQVTIQRARGNQCEAEQATEGTRVVIYGADDQGLGIGELENPEASPDGEDGLPQCVLEFSVPDVKGGEKVYKVGVGDLDRVSFSEDKARKGELNLYWGFG